MDEGVAEDLGDSGRLGQRGLGQAAGGTANSAPAAWPVASPLPEEAAPCPS